MNKQVTQEQLHLKETYKHYILDVDSADLKRKDPHATISSSIQAKAADLETLIL